MERWGIIYLGTNKVNGKQYVGQTTHPRPKRYWQGHHFYAASSGKSNRPIHRALRKYGRDAFEFIVIYTAFNQKELDRAEDHFIVEYSTLSPHGYNLKRGGRGGKFSDKGRDALREAMNRPDVKEKRARTEAMPETKKRRSDGIKQREDFAEIGINLQNWRGAPENYDAWLERMLAPEVKAQRYANLAKTNAKPEVSDRRSAAQVINQARPDVKIRQQLGTAAAVNDPKVKDKRRQTRLGCRWINNGTDNRQILRDMPLPDGWSPGRVEVPGKYGPKSGRSNHTRWHVNRGIVAPDCRFCMSGGAPPGG